MTDYPVSICFECWSVFYDLSDEDGPDPTKVLDAFDKMWGVDDFTVETVVRPGGATFSYSGCHTCGSQMGDFRYPAIVKRKPHSTHS